VEAHRTGSEGYRPVKDPRVEAKPCLHTSGCRGIANCSCENCRAFQVAKANAPDITDEDIRQDLARQFASGAEYGIARLRTFIKKDPDIMLRLLALAETVSGDDSDINVCPGCQGPADQGFDRCLPPSPYYCSKCDPPTCDICGHKGAEYSAKAAKTLCVQCRPDGKSNVRP
jgi:hypothetical protein